MPDSTWKVGWNAGDAEDALPMRKPLAAAVASVLASPASWRPRGYDASPASRRAAAVRLVPSAIDADGVAAGRTVFFHSEPFNAGSRWSSLARAAADVFNSPWGVTSSRQLFACSHAVSILMAASRA